MVPRLALELLFTSMKSANGEKMKFVNCLILILSISSWADASQASWLSDLFSGRNKSPSYNRSERRPSSARPVRQTRRATTPAGGLSCQNPQGAYNCMVCNCYHEAGNQRWEGQVAVGKVVKTRMYVAQQDIRAGRNPRYPTSECGNIKAHKQFSWWDGPGAQNRSGVPRGHSCFNAAKTSMAFNGYFADHYLNKPVTIATRGSLPKWARRQRGFQIQAHTFLALTRPQNTPRNSPFSDDSRTVACLDLDESRLIRFF